MVRERPDLALGVMRVLAFRLAESARAAEALRRLARLIAGVGRPRPTSRQHMAVLPAPE